MERETRHGKEGVIGEDVKLSVTAKCLQCTLTTLMAMKLHGNA